MYLRQKNKFFFLFLFLGSYCFSQKIEIIRPSGFKHNYVVSNLEYIEDSRDTSSLNYIATIKASGKTSNWAGIVTYWMDGVQTESRNLGANAFCLQSSAFNSLDSTGEIVLKIYFAGMKFLERNETRRSFNTIGLFSTFISMPADSFYLNKRIQYMDPKKCFVLKTETGVEYNLAVNDKIVPTKVKFTKQKPSRYFIIPDKKKTIATNRATRNPSKKGISAGALAGVGFGTLGAVAVNVGNNAPIEISYRDGRLTSEIFR